MPLDLGTITSVIIGGAITGSATVGAVMKREQLAEKRGAANEAREARGIALVASLQLLRAANLLSTAARARSWWPRTLELPKILDESELRKLAVALAPDQWALLHEALTQLVIAEAAEAIDVDRPAEIDVAIARRIQLVVQRCEETRAMLERFASGR